MTQWAAAGGGPTRSIVEQADSLFQEQLSCRLQPS